MGNTRVVTNTDTVLVCHAKPVLGVPTVQDCCMALAGPEPNALFSWRTAAGLKGVRRLRCSC